MMSATAPDFTTLTAGELALFAVAHQAELGVSGLIEADITEAIAAGRAILELRPYGFAIIEQKAASNGLTIPHLWLLFVSPDRRGKGLGRSFMRDLLRQQSREYPMSLYCVGSRQCKFFGRLSFKIESQDGDMRRMTYVEGCHQDWSEYLDDWLLLGTWSVADAQLLLAGIFPVEAEILEIDSHSSRYGVIEAPVVVSAGLLDHGCNARYSDEYERWRILAGKRLRRIREQWRSDGHSAERYPPAYFMAWAQANKIAPCWLEAKQIQIAADKRGIEICQDKRTGGRDSYVEQAYRKLEEYEVAAIAALEVTPSPTVNEDVRHFEVPQTGSDTIAHSATSPVGEPLPKGVTTAQIVEAFGHLVNFNLGKAMTDKARWSNDARLTYGTKGGKHKSMWSPVILASALLERYRVPMMKLNQAFNAHSFLSAWREEWNRFSTM